MFPRHFSAPLTGWRGTWLQCWPAAELRWWGNCGSLAGLVAGGEEHQLQAGTLSRAEKKWKTLKIHFLPNVWRQNAQQVWKMRTTSRLCGGQSGLQTGVGERLQDDYDPTIR